MKRNHIPKRGFHLTSFAYLLVPFLIAACNSLGGPKSDRKVDFDAFGKYWYQGQAELNTYDLEQYRYGEKRNGEAVLIFVTEDFSREKQVKLDNPQQHEQDAQKVLKRRAFSLLDMKRFAEARGYKATGYRMDLEFLVGLDQPVILPVTIRGYKHFVVFKGLVGDRAVIADPAFGNYTMRASRFVSIWATSIGFVLERDRPSGPMTREDLERRALFMPPHRLSVVATGTAPSFVPIAGKVQSVTGPRPVGGNLLDFLHITIPR